LNLFDVELETFRHYTTRDGLPSNHVSAILIDDKGLVWLATDNGLTKIAIDRETHEVKRVRSYDRRDGLHGNDFTFYYGQNATKTVHGELIFSGPKGFNIFHPDHIKENPHAPSVAISDVRINYEPVRLGTVDSPLQKHIKFTEHIELPCDRNTLTFEMVALDYRAPGRNRYAYKMEGYDKAWIDNHTKRSAHYTRLPWGDYTFRVRAANSDGIWNEQGASLRITITPPWWRTGWAYVVYTLFFLGSLYALRRYETNRQQHRHQAELSRVEAERLKELDGLKSQFFANVSHEFRTPLTLILGQVESVLSQIRSEGMKQKLRMAARNGKQLRRMINQLLDLAKIDAGNMALRAAPGNIVPLLRQLTGVFESLAVQKNIALQFESQRDELSVYYEREKMESTMYNVLSNALKFTPDGGSIRVQLTVDKDPASLKRQNTDRCLLMTVQDTGIGIPENHLPHIFNRFYQIDASHTREQEGTGIGLALTKELVELHGGKMTLESEEGVGTTVTIRLPLGSDHLKPEQMVEGAPSRRASAFDDQEPVHSNEQPTTPPSPIPTGRPGKEREIILIAEDNADMRSYIADHLRDSYTLLLAANGEEGLAQAQEAIPDLIVTDVMMPKVDGHQLTNRLRRDQKTYHIPVIMVTARAGDEERIEGLERGADAYLTKPFSPRELQVRVRKLIEMRNQLRQRFSAATVIKPSKAEVPSMDQAFLKQVIVVVEDHLQDPQFGLDRLAEAVNMSTSQLHRKLKAIIDQTPGQLIRGMRLQRAADLIVQQAGTIAQIAYQVGFGSQAHFTKMFRKQFGCTPTKYPKRKSA